MQFRVPRKLMVGIVTFVALTLMAPVSLFATGAAEQSGQQASGQQDDASERLVVYTYDVFPEKMQKDIVNHFEQQYGVTVEFQRFKDTGSVYNQLYLERNDPKADVVIGLDNTYLGQIFEHGLLTAYKPENLELRDDRLLVDPEYRAVPFDYGQITLNYNSEKLQNPPETMQGLLDSSLKESLIMMNPQTSTPGRNFLLFTIAKLGEENYLDFWRDLKPNILTITDGWSEGYGLYTQGEAPIVVSYETSPAYHRHFEDTTKYKNIFFDNEAYAQIEVAGIINGTERMTNAQRLMDYIVSPEFQKLIPLNQVMYPVHPDVELPEAFKQVERADNLVRLDAERVQKNLERWLNEWESVMR
jgi:thiamine transport system substrate-binding protein